jgi:hypothetical protein
VRPSESVFLSATEQPRFGGRTMPRPRTLKTFYCQHKGHRPRLRHRRPQARQSRRSRHPGDPGRVRHRPRMPGCATTASDRELCDTL